MSGVSKVYYGLTAAKNIRHKSVGINKVMMLLTRLHVSLSQQSRSEQSSSFDKVLILRAGSSIMDQLGNVNIACYCRRNIAAQKQKINYGKLKSSF